jgi:hypothetical protein
LEATPHHPYSSHHQAPYTSFSLSLWVVHSPHTPKVAKIFSAVAIAISFYKPLPSRPDSRTYINPLELIEPLKLPPGQHQFARSRSQKWERHLKLRELLNRHSESLADTKLKYVSPAQLIFLPLTKQVFPKGFELISVLAPSGLVGLD